MATVATAQTGKHKISSENVNKNYSITIHGVVKDSLKPDIRRLQLSVYEVFSLTNVFTNSIKYEYDTVNNSFEKKLAIPSKISHLTINYTNAKTIFPSYNYMKNYIVEDGDDLQCTFYTDSVVFSGKGSDKMNLQSKLFYLGSKYFYTIPEIANRGDDFYFENNISLFDRNYKSQIDLLQTYQGHISKDFYDYLHNQCLGWRNFAILSLICNSYKLDSTFNSRAVAFYKSRLQGMDTNYPEQAHLSPIFTDYIYRKEKLDFEINNFRKNTINKTGAPRFLAYLSNKYKGGLRERLLVIGLSDLPNEYSDAYCFLEEPVLFEENSSYFNVFNSIKKSLSIKVDAFPFSLPDSTGKIIKLTDYRGKVVVVDFWFTGCGACLVLAKKMGPIIESFKGRDVVFVTINVDKVKRYWVGSLKEGKYTHKGNVNLYTDGLGEQHPILSHYNVTAYPKLLIIDKSGRILSAEPPRPLDSDSHSTKNFINLIESGL
ncbi:Peroxiredoxin [Mucilaginibacter pineti]|uniref:Peroxiredoxin n=1 Tax=Mucilaginibacter pineti TaxID=1391627 RepID=A0A1G7H279_9SPHI|nr:TlpA disulfide reductase family protein [Mucilaginibacter pineti]SDE94517.1 Peroxiredoxin [Mucilaginibacter pineti]